MGLTTAICSMVYVVELQSSGHSSWQSEGRKQKHASCVARVTLEVRPPLTLRYIMSLTYITGTELRDLIKNQRQAIAIVDVSGTVFPLSEV